SFIRTTTCSIGVFRVGPRRGDRKDSAYRRYAPTKLPTIMHATADLHLKPMRPVFHHSPSARRGRPPKSEAESGPTNSRRRVHDPHSPSDDEGRGQTRDLPAFPPAPSNFLARQAIRSFPLPRHREFRRLLTRRPEDPLPSLRGGQSRMVRIARAKRTRRPPGTPESTRSLGAVR